MNITTMPLLNRLSKWHHRIRVLPSLNIMKGNILLDYSRRVAVRNLSNYLIMINNLLMRKNSLSLIKFPINQSLFPRNNHPKFNLSILHLNLIVCHQN